MDQGRNCQRDESRTSVDAVYYKILLEGLDKNHLKIGTYPSIPLVACSFFLPDNLIASFIIGEILLRVLDTLQVNEQQLASTVKLLSCSPMREQLVKCVLITKSCFGAGSCCLYRLLLLYSFGISCFVFLTAFQFSKS